MAARASQIRPSSSSKIEKKQLEGRSRRRMMAEPTRAMDDAQQHAAPYLARLRQARHPGARDGPSITPLHLWSCA